MNRAELLAVNDAIAGLRERADDLEKLVVDLTDGLRAAQERIGALEAPAEPKKAKAAA